MFTLRSLYSSLHSLAVVTVVFASSTDALFTQEVAMATIHAPTQNLPRLHPGKKWRAKRATPCQAGVVAVLACGPRIVATATAWVHSGWVQLANTTKKRLDESTFAFDPKPTIFVKLAP